MPGKIQPKIIIKQLSEKMAAKNTTTEHLAVRSGVSQKTISSARSGKPITIKLAEYILQALDEFKVNQNCGKTSDGVPPAKSQLSCTNRQAT